MSETYAKQLREVMSLGEGPEVDDKLYEFAVKKVEPSKVIKAKSWSEILVPFHRNGVDDQFIPPLVRVDENGKPVGTVKEGDVVFYFDFRTDRAKPLTASFLDIPYEGQVGGISDEAKKNAPKITMVTMTHYDDKFTSSPQLLEAFNPAEPLTDTYVEVAGKAGINQLICAETEKWRAISWFKDGRRNLGYSEVADDGQIRTDKHPSLPATIRVVRSRKVAAHIQAPVMRAKEIAEMLMQGIKDGTEDLFANFANADMVGHAMTQADWFDGVVAAIGELDNQLGRLVPFALEAGYTVFITGDHGNAEEMLHKDGKANPAHTTNKVPFICLGLSSEEKLKFRPDITIGDFAPTVLELRGIEKPSSWDRKSAFVGTVKPNKHRKIMRLVLDGYGVRDEEYGNAMAQCAKKKGSPLHMDRWMKGEDGAIYAPAEASGEKCGYPAGESGTTEFGHILFDAGRTVRSDLLLIDYAINSGEFNKNQAIRKGISLVKEGGKIIHLIGILSDGKVHSSLNHLEGVLKILKEYGIPKEKVSIHVITDGRDVPGDSSPKYIDWLEEKISEYGVGVINSIWGRGWGKDRDNRWKRIEAAFRSLTEGTGGLFVNL